MDLENYKVRALNRFPNDGMLGRRKIRTPVRVITADNVIDVVNAALGYHAANVMEIDYLYRYYRGQQDIRHKQKQVRESINNKVTVNRANEIVTFKTAYLLNKPIQYISYGGSSEVSDNINKLNEYMRAEDKESKDKEIVDWVHICGVGERLILDDKDFGIDGEEGSPFCLFTLDPRFAFVIYSSAIGEKPLAGVILQEDENGKTYADVYTDTMHYVLKDGKIAESYPTVYNGVPLVEYVNNEPRMGAFEAVISILNSINTLESDAVDSVEDFVNGFDVFQNCDIEDGTYSSLSIGGKAVKVKTTVPGMEAKVYRVFSEINQSGVQERIDDFTESYLTICGMPNRNGGSSTSDTGTAVIFRDGWSEAESRAEDSEKLFVRSERQMLKVALAICNTQEDGSYHLDLKLSDIKTEFLRKNLNNAQSKAQILTGLLNNSMVHPKLAYEAAALFKDNEEAYRISMEYYEKRQAEEEKRLQKELDNARTQALRNSRQDDNQS